MYFKYPTENNLETDLFVLLVEARRDGAEASGVQRRPCPRARRLIFPPPTGPNFVSKLDVPLDILHENALGVLAAKHQK